MTLKKKIFLISSVCIFVGGFLVSYKSYTLNQAYQLQSQMEVARNTANWVSQSVALKVRQLESAVSYLDPSTVETLKRIGARYFAYTRNVNGEWKTKWKVLGPASKQMILSEVKQINFTELSGSQRNWTFSKSGELILVSPVEVSGSKQLSTGFLIFGLNESFLKFVEDQDSEVNIFTLGKKSVIGKSDQGIAKKMGLFASKSVAGSVETIKDSETQAMAYTFFSPVTQLWVALVRSSAQSSFFSSIMFYYFLIALALSLAFLGVVISKLKVVEGDNLPPEAKSDLVPVLQAVLHRSRESLGQLKDLIQKKEGLGEEISEADAWFSQEQNQETLVTISDFSQWIENQLASQRKVLQKANIELRVQAEDGASIHCCAQHVSDFLKRLVGNSLSALEDEEEKRIQIELFKDGKGFQLVYLDTRRSHYPSKADASLLLQTESSLETIDGIIAYGSWLFGKQLTVAKQGFCLSIDLQASETQPAVFDNTSEVSSIDDPHRIEITDEDIIDIDKQGFGFQAIESEEKPVSSSVGKKEDGEEFSSQSIEDIFSNFELAEMNFTDATPEISEAEDTLEKEIQEEIKKDKKGLFEFDTGSVKIKIRSPKKRDMDANI